MPRVALLLLLVLIASPVTARGQSRDPATGLVISPPDYMFLQGEDLLAPPTVIACWHAPETDEYPWVKMCTERADRLPKADEQLSFDWQGRVLAGSRTRFHIGDEERVLYSVLLPLRQQTVRLDVVSPARGSDEAKAVLEEVLATVRDEGTTPVARAEESRTEYRTTRGAKRAGRVGVYLVVAGAVMWFRERRARRKRESQSAEAAT